MKSIATLLLSLSLLLILPACNTKSTAGQTDSPVAQMTEKCTLITKTIEENPTPENAIEGVRTFAECINMLKTASDTDEESSRLADATRGLFIACSDALELQPEALDKAKDIMSQFDNDPEAKDVIINVAGKNNR